MLRESYFCISKENVKNSKIFTVLLDIIQGMCILNLKHSFRVLGNAEERLMKKRIAMLIAQLQLHPCWLVQKIQIHRIQIQ